MNQNTLRPTQLALLAKLGTNVDPHGADGLTKMLSSSASVSPKMQQLAEVIARKREQEQSQITEEAAEVIMSVINSSDQAIENLRAENAAARRTAEAAVNKIEKIAVARVYGERTMNWLPLTHLLGVVNGATSFADAPEVPAAEAKAILAEIKGARAAAKKTAAK